MAGDRPWPEAFFGRLLKALLLDRRIYETIAEDSSATRQAAVIVCLSALAQPTVLIDDLGAWAVPIMLSFGLLRWALFTAIAHVVGRIFTSRPVAYKRLLRCLGFAEAPGIFSVVVHAFHPPVLTYVGFVVWFWMLSAAILAVRAALSVSGRKALWIAVLSFLFYLAPGIALGSSGPHACGNLASCEAPQ